MAAFCACLSVATLKKFYLRKNGISQHFDHVGSLGVGMWSESSVSLLRPAGTILLEEKVETTAARLNRSMLS